MAPAAMLGCAGAAHPETVARSREVAAETPPACETYEDPPQILATVSDPRLDEISGLAASRAHPGVLYVHNDSGEPRARFFAIDVEGHTLAELLIGDEPATDLEEIALGPGRDGRDAIYLADIGDNDARAGRRPRDAIHVLRVDEPRSLTASPEPLVLSPVDRFELRYPGRPVDAEAFFVDPESRDLYVLGKVAEGPAPLFVARAPLSTDTPNAMEQVGTLLPARDLGDSITASSLDASGRRLLVRTYRDAFLFTRGPDATWIETLAGPHQRLPRLHEPQGEAIAFLDAHGTIVSITEGLEAPLLALVPRCGAP